MRIGVLGAGMIATVSYGVLPQLGRLADRIGLVAAAGSRAPSSATSSPTISPRGVVGEAAVDDADEPVGECS
jgi:hypothetical protein